MNFSEITLNDKPLFDKALKAHNPQVSELTFTNLFAWRYFYKFRYTLIDGLLCIIAMPEKTEPYAFIPVGDLNKEAFEGAFNKLTEYFKQKGWRPVFRKISQSELEYFKNHISSQEDIVYDRNNSDYIYTTVDLINLKGKKYDGKRNHLNKFQTKNEYSYVPLDCSLIDECSRIMEDWCKTKNCNCQEGDYCERFANLEILYNYKTLGCRGALISVNGRFEAFSVGEMMNGDTAVIHIEKADTRIEGLYPFINQQFCKNEWYASLYINREQDLGIEGMRRAKLSYHPVRMVDKYTVYAL